MPNGEELDTNVEGGIETTTHIYVDGEREPLVRKVERTGVGVGGMRDSVEIFLRRASGCQHLLHTGSEAQGVCVSCQAVLCAKCAQQPESVCARCGNAVCGSCRRRVWLRAEDEDSVLCPRCARRWWLRELTVAGFIALFVFLVLAILLRH